MDETIRRVRRVRCRVLGEGTDYYIQEFTGSINVDDKVQVLWIDVHNDALVITTSEECVMRDAWLRPKPKVCPCCKQVIKEE